MLGHFQSNLLTFMLLGGKKYERYIMATQPAAFMCSVESVVSNRPAEK